MKDSSSTSNYIKGKKYTIISVTSLIILWQLLAMWINSPILVPLPRETAVVFYNIVSSPFFFETVFTTFMRMAIGFAITFSSAVVLGMLAGFISPIYYLLKPIVTLFKAVPTMGIILLAIIWLDSNVAPILVSFMILFPLLFQNVVHGIQNIDPKLIEMASVYKISRINKIKNIYLPSIQSHLAAGISTAIGLNVRIVIAAEVLSQPNVSIGTAFQIARANLNTAGVFAWSIIAIMLVGLFELIVRLLRKSTKALD